MKRKDFIKQVGVTTILIATGIETYSLLTNSTTIKEGQIDMSEYDYYKLLFKRQFDVKMDWLNSLNDKAKRFRRRHSIFFDNTTNYYQTKWDGKSLPLFFFCAIESNDKKIIANTLEHFWSSELNKFRQDFDVRADFLDRKEIDPEMMLRGFIKKKS